MTRVYGATYSRFQAWLFLAHYAAMCPNIEPENSETHDAPAVIPAADLQHPQTLPSELSRIAEIGGREGPEPTRFGDWEKAGRCIDF